MNGQRLRPLGVGDIFDEGFDLYKRNFVFLLLTAALTIAPLDIALAWAGPHILPPILDLFGVTASASDQGGVWAVSFLTRLTLFLPLYLLAAAPVVSAASGRYLDKGVTLGQVYGQWLRRLPGLLLTALLLGLALALGLVGCGVLWAVPATLLLFTLHALLVENKPPFKALGRSNALANGMGGRVFNCLILLGLVAYVLGLGLRLPLAYVFDTALNIAPAGGGLGGGPGSGQNAEQQVVSLLSGGLAHLVLIPFLVCVVTVLYYDMRIRKEGYDVDLLAEDLGYLPLSALGPHLPPAPVYGVRPGVVPPPRPGPAPRPPRRFLGGPR